MVRTLALTSKVSGFKTRSGHSLNLFLLVPGSTSRPHLQIANWFAPGQLCRFLAVVVVEFCRFIDCVSLKSPYGEWSIKYYIYFLYMYIYLL